MTKTSGSRRISSAMASRNASRMVMVTISVPAGTSGSGAAGSGVDFCVSARLLRGAWPSAASPVCAPECFAGCGAGGLGAAPLPSLSALASSPSARIDGDRRIDRDVVGAFRHQNLAERAFVDRLHFHGGLVGLDLGDHVAGLDGVAFLLEPLGEVALLHRGRQRGHEDFGWHGVAQKAERVKIALNDTCRCKARTDPARDRGWRTRQPR